MTYVRKDFLITSLTRRILTKYKISAKLLQISHTHEHQKYNWTDTDHLLLKYKFYGRSKSGMYFSIFGSCQPLRVVERVNLSRWCIPSSSWPSLASKYLVLPHFVLCLKVLCLLVLHWIVLSHLLFYWFGLLPLRPHIVWDFPVWSFSILSSLVFVLYHMIL